MLDPAVTMVGGGSTAVADPAKPAVPAVVTPTPAAEPAKVDAVVPATPALPVPATKTETTSVPATAAWATPAKKADDKAATPAGEKAKEPVPAIPVATEFTLKAPEGVKLEPAVLEGYKTLSKDLGLTSDQAQKLYERDLAMTQESHREGVASLQRQDAAWFGELQNKWGEKFQERSITVSRAYDYADPDGSFRASLKKAGLLNNPLLTEFVERFGTLFKEDRTVVGTTAVPKTKDTRPQHVRLAEEFEKLNKSGR
jgi:hypothetical protein